MTPIRSIQAEPYAFSRSQRALVIIDMQRDVLEPGGFGEMLGNDVSQLHRAIQPNRRLLSAWRAAGLAILQSRGITQLIVTGVTTEVCVHTTVREANDRGYDCLVVADCCASYFPEFHDCGLRMIKAQGGIFGWVPGDCNVLFGFGANILVNVLV